MTSQNFRGSHVIMAKCSLASKATLNSQFVRPNRFCFHPYQIPWWLSSFSPSKEKLHNLEVAHGFSYHTQYKFPLIPNELWCTWLLFLYHTQVGMVFFHKFQNLWCFSHHIKLSLTQAMCYMFLIDAHFSLTNMTYCDHRNNNKSKFQSQIDWSWWY